MLTRVKNIEISEKYYDIFLEDCTSKPYEYCTYFDDLIAYLNEIFIQKSLFCKKLKNKKWTFRVYINADNPLAKILTDIVVQIFTDHNCICYETGLRNADILDIKNKLDHEYQLPLNTCVYIKADFYTLGKLEFGFNGVEYEDMIYNEIFWRSYIRMMLPYITYGPEDEFKFDVDLKSVSYVSELLLNDFVYDLPDEKDSLEITMNKNNTATFKLYNCDKDEIEVKLDAES